MISEQAYLVKNRLIEHGLETPQLPARLSPEQKREKLTALFAQVMDVLELDRSDDSLQDTPSRISKMYVNEIFSGLDYGNFPSISVVDNKMQVDEMVKISEINLTSTCEHHFITIDGMAKVAYIPKDKVLGLSKINRIVQFFAQRPQIQERLTQQILVAIQTLVESQDVAVTINATHYCVKARGIRDTNSYTQTTALGGVFKSEPQTRAEFLAN